MKPLFILIGLVLGMYMGNSKDPRVLLCLVLFALLALFFSKKKGLTLWFIGGLTVGLVVGFIRLPVPFGKGTYTGIIVRTSDNYVIVFSRLERFYVYAKGHSFELGDIVSFVGKVEEYSFSTYEGRFDFGEYLSSIGVRASLASFEHTFLFKNPVRIRAMENLFLGKLDENASALASSLLFNRKNYESSALIAANSLNIVFILSNSGLLYGMLLRRIEAVLKYKLKDRTAERIMLFLSLFFLLFSIDKIGIRRVFLLRLLRYINKYCLKEQFEYFDLLGFAGIIFFLLNPYDVIATGFLLGFGASYCSNLSGVIFSRYKKTKKKLLGFLLIRLLILPLSLESSGGLLHLFAPIYAEILLIPVSLFQFVGYLSFLLFPFPQPINFLGNALTNFLLGLSKVDPSLRIPIPGTVFQFLYYLLLISSLYFIEVGVRRYKNILIGVYLGSYVISLLPILPLASQEVTFINVGQGDSILIRDHGKVVLLDTGGNLHFDMAKEVLIPYLYRKRIYHIDCLIASHGDFDHIGAKDSLMSNFRVYNYVDKKEDFPITIGNIKLTNYNVYGGKEENETSLVLGLSFMDKRWLFTGDATISIEKKIILDNPSLKADILKAGHHGSDTSSCEEFLKAISPETAIISVGKKNSYGHPSKAVISRMEKLGIKIRRTDLEGTITYKNLSLG